MPVTYTLTINVVGDGQVLPQSGVYQSGEVVNLSAIPSENTEFLAWSGAVLTTTTPINLVMDGDKTITATFDSTSSIYLPLVMNNGGGGASSIYLPLIIKNGGSETSSRRPRQLEETHELRGEFNNNIIPGIRIREEEEVPAEEPE